MPALLTSPKSGAPARLAFTVAAACPTAFSSVTSNRSGTKFGPSSFESRSASAGLRTLPKTLKPCAMRTFAAPWPIPVDAPVTTTDFIALLLVGLLPQYSSLFSSALPRMKTHVDSATVEFAHRLADAAGEVIRPYFRKRIAVMDKAKLGGSKPLFDPVT